MQRHNPDRPAPLDRLPEPHAVRERLGQLLRETDFLRRLLRLAERAAKDRDRGAPQKGGRP